MKTAVPRLCAACDGDAASLALAALARVSAASADARRVAVTTLWSRLGGARRPDPVWTKPLWKDFVDAMAGPVPKTASSGSGSVPGMLQSAALDPSTAAGGGEEDAAARDIAPACDRTAPSGNAKTRAGSSARPRRSATRTRSGCSRMRRERSRAASVSERLCRRRGPEGVAEQSRPFSNCEDLARRLVSRAGGGGTTARSATEALSSPIHKLGASGAPARDRPGRRLWTPGRRALSTPPRASPPPSYARRSPRARTGRGRTRRGLVTALSSPSREVAAGAARAFGVAMSPGGGGPGLTRECHGSEKKLFRQRFFTQTVPAVMAALKPSSRSGQATTNPDHRPAHLSALVHLARHAPISAVLQSGDSILPVLAEAINALADQSTPFADKDALAGSITMTAAFLSDPRGGTRWIYTRRNTPGLSSARCVASGRRLRGNPRGRWLGRRRCRWW